MDQMGFALLNSIPANIPGVGTGAVLVARFGIALYAAIGVWVWLDGRGNADERRGTLLLALLAVALALGVNLVLNAAFPRPRPFLVLPAHVLVPSPPHDASFPSDHAAVAGAVSVVLLLGGQSGWGTLGLLGAVLIGVARVMVGVHYPSDVVAGVMIGAACAVVASRARPPLRPLLAGILAVARRVHLA
ncbi:MAG TPA: phosphatase PAP2 family protein [bacterium]|nr:phosphatase PAP2 family protein [bacterium]